MNERILDGGVLKRSKLGQMLQENSLNLLAPERLPGRSRHPMCLLMMMRSHYNQTS